MIFSQRTRARLSSRGMSSESDADDAVRLLANAWSRKYRSQKDLPFFLKLKTSVARCAKASVPFFVEALDP